MIGWKKKVDTSRRHGKLDLESIDKPIKYMISLGCDLQLYCDSTICALSCVIAKTSSAYDAPEHHHERCGIRSPCSTTKLFIGEDRARVEDYYNVIADWLPYALVEACCQQLRQCHNNRVYTELCGLPVGFKILE